MNEKEGIKDEQSSNSTKLHISSFHQYNNALRQSFRQGKSSPSPAS